MLVEKILEKYDADLSLCNLDKECLIGKFYDKDGWIYFKDGQYYRFNLRIKEFAKKRSMDERFFAEWFGGFDAALEKMDIEECSRLFAKCAQRCSCDALKNLYRDLFDECDGDLDKFFTRVNEKKDVDGKVLEPGSVYELIFTKCGCPLHTQAGVKSNRLCECSRQSMICVFKNLVPQRNFKIECVESVLSGGEKCRHIITFDN